MLWNAASFAQDPGRSHHIGVHETFTDYNVILLDGKVFAFDSSLSHTTRVSYTYQPNHNWLFTAGISHGFILNQTFEQQHFSKLGVFGADLMVQLKLNNGWMWPQDSRVAPYLGFGYRIDRVEELKTIDLSPYLLHNQYAAGTHIRLTTRTYVQLQAAVDQKLVGDFNTHMQYRIGLIQSLGQLRNATRPLPFIADGAEVDPDQDSLRQLVEHMEFLVLEQELLIDSLNTLLEEGTEYPEEGTDPILTSGNTGTTENDMPTNTAVLTPAISHPVETPVERQQSVPESPSENQQVRQETTTAGTQEPVATPREEELDTEGQVPVLALGDAPKGWYAVVISVKDRKVAEVYHQRLIAAFEEVYVLKQPNGFYRVGVFAGPGISKAKSIRDALIANGYESVWVVKH